MGLRSMMTVCDSNVAACLLLFSSFLFSHAGRPQLVLETQRLLFLSVARAHCTEQPGTAGLSKTGQRENKTVDITHSSVTVAPYHWISECMCGVLWLTTENGYIPEHQGGKKSSWWMRPRNAICSLYVAIWTTHKKPSDLKYPLGYY